MRIEIRMKGGLELLAVKWQEGVGLGLVGSFSRAGKWWQHFTSGFTKH